MVKVYWGQEKNGGSPPSFTLFHLAAYFGNAPWAELLISKHARLISQKGNDGRMPLSWAVNQGHRECISTAFHITVTRQHGDVVSVQLEHSARLEAKAEHGDTGTPLMRAILANSREITQELLEHRARVDRLPAVL
ncbi:ankyrin repeat-containing domain protein [Aspergillus desertorum]